MSTKVYTLRDSKTEVYNLPWYQRTHGEAERYVKTILGEDPKQLPGYYATMAKNPEDFDLFYIGEYDEQSGKHSLLDAPQHLVKAIDLKSTNA